jgi:crotonobetainyl-CoA:carnitine CoA-transferase CaiB-like acyl-CoA transferase
MYVRGRSKAWLIGEPGGTIEAAGDARLRARREASLRGVRLVTLAQNVPGPAAAARLQSFGASVVKVEPPNGDPLASSNPAWYESLAAGQEVVRLDLKSDSGRDRLDEHLAEADVLLTSNRLAALARLGLGPEELGARYPRLCYVAITATPRRARTRPATTSRTSQTSACSPHPRCPVPC